MLRIERVNPHLPEVAALVAQLDRYQLELYGAACCHLDSLEELSRDNVVMIGAFEHEVLAGIGAVKLLEGYAELKRIIVADGHLRRGVARAIMQWLEALAHERGQRTLRLETGVQQAAARSLYRALGYAERGPFGCYVPNGVSVFMEKTLPAIDLDTALAQASDEIGLPSYYRSCVRPLLRQPKHEWPTCCGAGCDPCAQTLVAVAERVLSLTTKG